jgi:nucleotide-binding universal stress UspA family protein
MTTTIKTILAATDLSRPAFAAVRRAALIARAHGATLELLHVIPDSFSSAAWNDVRAAIDPLESVLRQSADQALDALVQQIAVETGIRANALVAAGKPFAEIAARSEALDADLVVVGAHGENFLLTPLLGTTAHRILRLSRKPVLLVKQTPHADDPSGTGYKHAVIATDFAADSAHAAKTARQLFPEMSATLFHAYHVPFEAKLSSRVPQATLEDYRRRAAEQAHNELEAFANATQWSDAPRVVRHGPPGVRVREYAAEIAADLIVTGSEQLPRLQRALLGSVSLDLVTEAKCDVLLARTAPAIR